MQLDGDLTTITNKLNNNVEATLLTPNFTVRQKKNMMKMNVYTHLCKNDPFRQEAEENIFSTLLLKTKERQYSCFILNSFKNKPKFLNEYIPACQKSN